MPEKGQITVEAILILGLFILLFVGISMPTAFQIYDRSTDTSVILEMRTNTDVIVSAIKIVIAGGSGSVRTVKIKSNVANWELSAYDTSYGSPTLTYGVKWSNAEDVPSELINNAENNTWGGLSKASMGGIATSGTTSRYTFSGTGQGNWYVKVTNSATSTSPTLDVSTTLTNGDTIEITLTN